jgi:hypothetical protein
MRSATRRYSPAAASTSRDGGPLILGGTHTPTGQPTPAYAAVTGERMTTSITIPPIDSVAERYPLCIVWTPIPLITWILPFVGHMGIANSEGIIHDFAGPFFISEDSLAFGNPVKYLRLDEYILPKVPNSRDLAAATHGSAVPINGGGGSIVSSSTAGDATTPGGASDVEPHSGAPLGAPLNPKGCTVTHPLEVNAIRKYDDAIAGMRDYFRATQPYNFFTNNCHSYVAWCLETGDIGKTRGHKWDMVRLAAYVFFFGKYVSPGRFLLAHGPTLVIIAIIAAISTLASSVPTPPR